MNAIARTLRFVVFTLVEYIRSGRILAELLAAVAFSYLFFRRQETPMQADYFFSAAGLFTLALTFYTSSTIQSLGDRPQGYLLLMRRLGRAGYVLGLYLAVVMVVWAAYALLALGVALHNPPFDLVLRGWLLGSLPLALNVALLAALLLLMAPMILTTGWRLAMLSVIAIAFSGNLLGGQTLRTLPAFLATTLEVLRAIFSTILLPAFTGFALSVSRDYDGIAFAIPLAQLSLTLGLLALAIYAFSRREIIFSSG